MEKHFLAAIFDLDGVLVKTDHFHYRAWKKLADELGIPFDENVNHRLRGVSRLRSLEIILEAVPGHDYELEPLAERKNNYYVEMIKTITPADLLPGVGELLQNLKQMGVKVGVASTSKNARPVIDSLGIMNMLNTVTDGLACAKAKPAPDVYLKCAKSLSAEPSNCVVVEDAQAGIDGARKAGMFAVGVDSEKKLAGTDLLISETSQLPLSLWHP
jgi:beta-phosphoglucomutase